MSGRLAQCYLCGAGARDTTLRRVGRLWRCSDRNEEKCDERRADRTQNRNTTTLKAGRE